jgi:hypothetical protein
MNYAETLKWWGSSEAGLRSEASIYTINDPVIARASISPAEQEFAHAYFTREINGRPRQG